MVGFPPHPNPHPMKRKLLCTAPGQLAWQEYEEPPLQADEVRLQHEYGVEKHGTMMAFYKGYGNQRGRWDEQMLLFREGGMLWNYPVPLGNMQIGTVVECGPAVTQRKLGDRVFHHGGFQPSAVLSENSGRLLPAGLDWRDAMLLDPAEFALGAIRDGQVRLGDTVAVFGLGAIGLVTVQLAKLAGASSVWGIDPLPNRRAAADRLGADRTLDPVGHDVGLILKELTAQRGVDVAIEFSGSSQALQAALRGVAYLGTVVCGAFPPPYGAGLDFGAEAHMNRPTLVFSRACSEPNPEHPRWTNRRIIETCAELIQQGKLRGEGIVDPPTLFADLLENYPRIAAQPSSTIKLSVHYSTRESR